MALWAATGQRCRRDRPLAGVGRVRVRPPRPITLALVPWVSLRFETQGAYDGERGQRVDREHGPSSVDWEPDWPFAESDLATLPGPAETYGIDAQDLTGFVVPDLGEMLDQLVRDDIGGDEQRVHSLELTHRERGIRVLLAPVWTGKLAHMDRVFAINVRLMAFVAVGVGLLVAVALAS